MSNNIDDVTTYYEAFLDLEEANELFKQLMGYPDLTNMLEIETPTGKFKYNFGKMMFLDRELINENTFPKSIWGNNMEWSEHMLLIKKRIENSVNKEFDTCVCIYYPDGNSGVDYHSDEVAFGDTKIIPSISLGEERQFCLREKKTMTEHSMILNHGSLLIMKEGCQEYYEHSLPLDARCLKPRINLTFRKKGF